MTVLLTGANGFLGRRVLGRLLARGCSDIRCMVRDTAKSACLTRMAYQYPASSIEVVCANLRNKEDVKRALRGVDLVFHLAASLKGTPADMFLDTVVGSRNLLDGLGRHPGLRVVLVSSLGVFGTAELGRGALVSEQTPLERHPQQRDTYSHVKLRQEQLFREYAERWGFELVIVRPGVIYGPEGSHFSSRVGLSLGNVFLHLGGRNRLPLTYVDNCAEAVVFAGLHPRGNRETYNVIDDDIPTCREYLRRYKKEVRLIRSLRIPYPGLMILSHVTKWYYEHSGGQLPALFTPYKTATTWGGNRFDNSKLKSIGWKQLVSTRDAMNNTLTAFRAEHHVAR